jgi:hypothetical protein
MSGFIQELECKCGHRQKSAAVSAFKCAKCGLFNYVSKALERGHKTAELLAAASGRLGGYCASCGLMKIKQDKACPRCGGTAVTKNAPPEAGHIVAVSLLGRRPQIVGDLR